MAARIEAEHSVERDIYPGDLFQTTRLDLTLLAPQPKSTEPFAQQIHELLSGTRESEVSVTHLDGQASAILSFAETPTTAALRINPFSPNGFLVLTRFAAKEGSITENPISQVKITSPRNPDPHHTPPWETSFHPNQSPSRDEIKIAWPMIAQFLTTAINKNHPTRHDNSFGTNPPNEGLPTPNKQMSNQEWGQLLAQETSEETLLPNSQIGVMHRTRTSKNGHLWSQRVIFFKPSQLLIEIPPQDRELTSFLQELARQARHEAKERQLTRLGGHLNELLDASLKKGTIPKARRQHSDQYGRRLCVPRPSDRGTQSDHSRCLYVFPRAVENALTLLGDSRKLLSQKWLGERLAFALVSNGGFLVKQPEILLTPSRFDQTRRPVLTLAECTQVHNHIQSLQKSKEQPHLPHHNSQSSQALGLLGRCHFETTQNPHIFRLSSPIRLIH